LRAHRENHGELLKKVNRLFNTLKIELEEHLIKEEEKIFPLIKEYSQSGWKNKKYQAAGKKLQLYTKIPHNSKSLRGILID
jgi:regulator of cell morphogenesis and NO signaling